MNKCELCEDIRQDGSRVCAACERRVRAVVWKIEACKYSDFPANEATRMPARRHDLMMTKAYMRESGVQA